MNLLPFNDQASNGRFIGLDLAKKESQLSALNNAGEQIHSRRFASSRDCFLQLSSELTSCDTVALEVTTNAFSVARLLSSSGARILLSNPIKTRIIAESKIKTDKIDARVLAELARVDYLPQVWMPDEDTQALRHLFSDRRSLVDRRTELKNRIHSVLHCNLIAVTQSDLFGVEGRAWLDSIVEKSSTSDSCLSLLDQLRVKSMLSELDSLEQRIEESESIIASFIVARPKMRKSLDRLLSIPGVSLVVGAGLLSAVGDIDRFSSAKRLASYFGLVPSTYQSGDLQARHGRITKRGRSQGRWLAVEAAEHLRRAPGPMRALYTRISRKRGHNVAVVAVARKLVELIWYMLKKEQDYIYNIPRLTDEKRARVRTIARRKVGIKTSSAAKNRGGRTALYGTGIEGRSFRTRIAREAAQEAERLYEAIVSGKELKETISDSEFNPTRPTGADWEGVLERVTARVLGNSTKKQSRTIKR
jgi:transposase